MLRNQKSEIRNHKSAAFTSVGAFCQRVFRVCFGAVVLSMLRLKCLVKRKEALRGRNLSRDSQVEGAPMVHPTSDVHVASEVVFCAPIGHLRDASENPNVGNAKTVEVATSGSPRLVVVWLRFLGGIVWTILRRRSKATRRLNSPLRSHRTGRVSPRSGSSGLNKTLCASVGPNSRCRGHRPANPDLPGSSLEGEKRRRLGRMNAGRGHRLDGMSRTRSLASTPDIAKIPPRLVDRSRRFKRPPFGPCGPVWPRGPCWPQGCGQPAGRCGTGFCRGSSQRGSAAGGAPWRHWPWA